MSNYSFLEKLRNEEKKRIPDDSKLIKIAVLGGAPISTQFGKNVGVNFTGYGEDGVLQPQNPAKMVETQNGTSMLHEGELEIKLPDGRTTIIPANQVPQDLMMKIQSTQLRGEPMQGYACGGKYMRKYAEGGTFERPTESQISPNNLQRPDVNMPRPNINIPNKQLNFGIPNNKIPNPIIGQDKINQIGPFNKKINTNPIVGPDIKNPDFGINKQLIAPDIKIPDLGIQNPIQTSQITAPDIKLPDFGVTNQTTQTQTPVTTTPNQYQKYLSQLSQYAQGVNPLQKQIQAETQEQYKAEEQAQKEALNQQLAQTGVTGREAVSEQAMASRQMGANQAQVESELRKQRADQAFAAAQQLPSMQMAEDKFNFDKGMTSIDLALKTGDYGSINNTLKGMGLKEIDFTKLDAIQTTNTVVSSINDMISGLGPNANPQLLAFLGGLKGNIYSNLWDKLGIGSGGDGTIGGLSFNNLINAVNNGTTDQNTTNTLLNIGTATTSWLKESVGGEMFTNSLMSNDSGKQLIDLVNAKDPNAIKEYGSLIGAAFAQDSGYPLNDMQREKLKKYGLYDEGSDIGAVTWETVAPKVSDIEKAIKEGDKDKAGKIYSSLSDAEKKLVGTLESYVTKHEEHLNKINLLTTGSFNDVVSNFPTDKNDPIYQELLNGPSVVKGLGNKKHHTGKGNNQYFYSNLGATGGGIGMKAKSGDLFNIDGNIYIFKGVSLNTQAGSDENVYTFYDPITKKEITYKTGH